MGNEELKLVVAELALANIRKFSKAMATHSVFGRIPSMMGKRHTKHSPTNVAWLVETNRDCVVQEAMALLDDPVVRERMAQLGESLRRWKSNPQIASQALKRC